MIVWSFDSGTVIVGYQEWQMEDRALVSIYDVKVYGKIWRNQKCQMLR